VLGHVVEDGVDTGIGGYVRIGKPAQADRTVLSVEPGVVPRAVKHLVRWVHPAGDVRFLVPLAREIESVYRFPREATVQTLLPPYAVGFAAGVPLHPVDDAGDGIECRLRVEHQYVFFVLRCGPLKCKIESRDRKTPVAGKGGAGLLATEVMSGTTGTLVEAMVVRAATSLPLVTVLVVDDPELGNQDVVSKHTVALEKVMVRDVRVLL
jgi:hypothetical protein